MMIKNKGTFLHKALAGVLTIATVITSVAVMPTGLSAVDYYVKFINNVTGKEELATTLLEGETIYTNKSTPEGYEYQTVPFRTDESGIITSTRTQLGIGMTAVEDIPDVVANGSETYNVTPQFNALLTKSDTSTVTCKTDPKDINKETILSFGAEITNNKKVSITKQSTLTFIVLEGEEGYDEKVVTNPDGTTTIVKTPNGKQTKLNFDEIKATGDLTRYDQQAVTFSGMDGDKLKLTVVSAGSDSLDFTITPSSKLPILHKGTTFVVKFSLQDVDAMQLTVISRPQAVKNITEAVGVPTNFKKFIQLAGNDTQHAIANNFSVVCVYDDFNYKGFKIEWKWVADKTENQNFVIINPPKPGATIQTVTATQQLESISGSLLATAIFEKKQSDGTTVTVKSAVTATIPITIIGTGTKPALISKFAYTGQGANASSPITEPPLLMDVNDGTHADFPLPSPPNAKPYRFVGELNFGSGTQKARKARIHIRYAQNGKADIYLGSSTTPYVSDALIDVPNPDKGSESAMNFEFVARQGGQVVFEVIFLNESNTEFEKKTYTVKISDTSPSKDASFKSIDLFGEVVTAAELTGDNDDSNGDNEADKAAQAKMYKERFEELYGTTGIIPFGFESGKEVYEITVPFAVSKVNILPIYNYLGDKTKLKPVTVICGDKTWNLNGIDAKLPDVIPLPNDGKGTQIFINGTAQDGSISNYELNIKRAPQSSVASLESLSVMTYFDKKDKPITPAFAPDIYFYELSLPYAYRGVPKTGGAEITAVSVGDWGEKPVFTGDTVITKGFFAELFSNKNSKDVELKYVVNADGEVESLNEVFITVRSEDRKQEATYRVAITIEDPSENNMLSDLKTFQKDGVTEVPYVGGQAFNKMGRDFYIDIPYKTEKLWFSMLPDDDKITHVRMTHPDIYAPPGSIIDPDPQPVVEKKYTKKGEPIRLSVEVPFKGDTPENTAATSDFIYEFEARAENEHWTSEDTEAYKLHIHREPANNDARLASLEVTDIVTSKPLEEFVFNPINQTYNFNVPYDIEEILVTPVASKPELSLVTVNETKIIDGRLNKNIKLEAGKVTKVEIVVVPESGEDDKMVYTLNITRKAPGTESRLIKLAVGGSDSMTPDPFVPSTLSYSATIPEGTATFTITPTAVDEKATITIDGKAAKSGQPFGPIASLQATTTYTIEVTAQDTKTKSTYKLTVTDYNLVKKSESGILTDVELNYGDLKPDFRTNIDTYQIFLKPDAKKLELMPEASAKAKVTVTVGSKIITQYNGMYATSVFDDKSAITIKVVPESGNEANSHTYTFNVIKNDKKEQGAFKPITSDLVNYEQADPIVIDISNYAVVDAGVFNKLKTEYPKKSIVFTGNDYMLKIKGEDIKELVPHTKQYDLAFSFTTPDESVIDQILWNSDNYRDWEIDPVYLYFDDHGPLPGQMLLTVSLGKSYNNRQLFWNYFNDERERIDYYGYVNSNAKGTITVPLTHLSTYMVTYRRIGAAEDKTNMGFGWMQNNKPADPANGNTTTDKDVPKTGV